MNRFGNFRRYGGPSGSTPGSPNPTPAPARAPSGPFTGTMAFGSMPMAAPHPATGSGYGPGYQYSRPGQNGGGGLQSTPNPSAQPSASSMPGGSSMMPIALRRGGPVRRPMSYADGGAVDDRRYNDEMVQDNSEMPFSPMQIMRGDHWQNIRDPNSKIVRGNAGGNSMPNEGHAETTQDVYNKRDYATPSADNNMRKAIADDMQGDVPAPAPFTQNQKTQMQTDAQSGGMSSAAIPENSNTDSRTGNLDNLLDTVNDLFMHTYQKFGLGGNNGVDQTGVPASGSSASDDDRDAAQEPDSDSDDTVSLAEGGPVETDANGNDAEYKAPPESLANKVKRGFKENDDSLNRGADNAVGKVRKALNFADGGAVPDDNDDDSVDPTGQDGDVTGSVTEQQAVPDQPQDSVLDRVGGAIKRGVQAIKDYGNYEDVPADQRPGAQPMQSEQGVDEAGFEDQPQQPQQGKNTPMAMIGGAGAMHPGEFEWWKKQADPQGVMNDSDRNALALLQMTEAQGPEEGTRGLQLLRAKYTAYQQDALVSLQGVPGKGPDLSRATQSANRMFPHLPDGTDVFFTPSSDGVRLALTSDGKVTNVQLDQDQFSKLIKSAQFDQAFHGGIEQLVSKALAPPETPAISPEEAKQKEQQEMQADSEKKTQQEKLDYNRLEKTANRLFPSVGQQDQRNAWIAARMGKESEQGSDLAKAEAGMEGRKEVARITGQSRENVGKGHDEAKRNETASKMDRLDQGARNKMAQIVQQHAGRMQEGALKNSGMNLAKMLGNPAFAVDPDLMDQTMKKLGLDPEKVFNAAGADNAPAAAKNFQPAGNAAGNSTPAQQPPIVRDKAGVRWRIKYENGKPVAKMRVEDNTEE